MSFFALPLSHTLSLGFHPLHWRLTQKGSPEGSSPWLQQFITAPHPFKQARTGHNYYGIALTAVVACGLGGCARCTRPLDMQARAAGKEEEGLHLHSRCFFLGAITSCVVALQTARAMSDPVSWYCAAAMRSVSVCPDIFSLR